MKRNKIYQHGIGLLSLFFTVVSFGQQQNNTLPVETFFSKIQQQQHPQIIDARGAEEFALNHINGAINFTQASEYYAAAVAALDKTKPVFIYSIGAGRSVILTKELLNTGFKEVYNLQGGIANWIGSGKPFYSNSKNKLTAADYQKIISDHHAVLVDVGSKYCGACKKVKPILENIRAQYGENLKIVEIEFEENPQIVSDLNIIKVFPSLIFYQDGKIIFKKDGFDNLKKDVDEVLAQN
jgi:rhodanese-related sulfurtransferase